MELINNIFNQLKYNPQEPMIFSCGFFLYFFLFTLLFYQFIYGNKKARVIYLTILSFYFYYKSSGLYFFLLIISSVVDYHLSHYINNAQTKSKKLYLLIFSLVVNFGLLAYFKYTNFFISTINSLSGTSISLLDIFLPVGISFYTFQTLSYTIDVYRGKLKPINSLLDFCFYVSFFPQLVAGPIVRASDFLPQINKKIFVSSQDLGRGFFLICTGLFKKAVIADYISTNFVDRVFQSPTQFSGVENLLAVYGYALQIYCDFSGYTDIAIGIALLLGFHLNINFNSPYKAWSVTEFWHRWHISLSTWLRDYLYISLGGNRKGKFRQLINLMITMLLGGLWHGANWKFVFWGGLHGIGLVLDKLLQPFQKGKITFLAKFVGIIITFHFVCLSWIFFRADSFQTAWLMIQQIIFSFQGNIFLEWIVSYQNVFFWMIVGFVLHFLPTKLEEKAQQIFTDSHLLLKSATLLALIWLVIQVKSAEIQPFIYFQF